MPLPARWREGITAKNNPRISCNAQHISPPSASLHCLDKADENPPANNYYHPALTPRQKPTARWNPQAHRILHAQFITPSSAAQSPGCTPASQWIPPSAYLVTPISRFIYAQYIQFFTVELMQRSLLGT
jgi:hypothetical protein